MSNLTSLTIGGSEWISKLKIEGTEYTRELGGNISTATFVVGDTIANINGIVAQSEVIAYIGSEKVWGGYLAMIRKLKTSATTMRAELRCQDYAVLMDRAVATAEHVFTGTDEAALDTLFSTYCSAISTTLVNQVVSNLQGLTVPVGTSIRKAVEMIQERSGAESYVTPNKALEYFDPASDAPTCPFWLRESPTVLYDGDMSSGWTPDSTATYTAATGTLIEAASTSQHYFRLYNQAAVVGEQYMLSVDVKPNGRTWVALASQADSYHATWFDIDGLALGTVNATHNASIIALGDGWVRCTIGFEATSTGTNHALYLDTNNGGSLSYAGDGSSGIYVRAGRFATGHPIHREDFSHETDASLLANDITVRAGADGTETIDIPCELGPSDGHVYKQDDFNWPPTGTATPDGGASPNYLRVGHTGSTYYIQLPLMKFDTSVIPDDATITSAELHLYVTGTPVSASGNGIGIEYYAAANWPIAAGDWTSTPAQDAYAYANPTINALADNSFTLLNPDSNIVKDGETGLRMHYSFTGTPASDYIEMSFASVDGGAGQGPFLRVTYTAPAIQSNATDSTSITAYGTLKATIVDTSIKSAAEAALSVAVELARRKDPMEYGSFLTFDDGIHLGDLVHLESDSYDVDAEFLVRAIRTSWPEGICMHAIDYGDWRPDAVRFMRQLTALKEQG